MKRQVLFCAVVLLLSVAHAPAQQKPAAAPPDPKAKADPKLNPFPAQWNMEMSVNDIQLGTHVCGPKIEAGDLQKRVVLVEYWGKNCFVCSATMPTTEKVWNELRDLGLVVVGAHLQPGTALEVERKAQSLNATFHMSQMTFVKGTNDSNTVPHCIVFDHEGKCIFRGMPNEAATKARLAMGAMLVEKAGREKFSRQIEPIVQELKKGTAPLSLLPKLAVLQTSAGEVGLDARALVTSLTSLAAEDLEKAAELAKSEPLESFLLIEKLPTTYKGTTTAKKAAELLVTLRKEKAVAAEVAARPSLELVRKLDAELGAKLNAAKPDMPAFRKENAVALRSLKDRVAFMQKSWPDVPATQQAKSIAERYLTEAK